MTTSSPARSQLLPGGLLGAPGARRSVRDWLVDAGMYFLALVVGAIVLVDSASTHTPALWVVDLVLGTVALIALWWRRRFPVAVAVVILLASAVSGLAGGAALAATFNVAVRGSRRAITLIALLAFATSAVYPLIYPQDLAYAWQLLLAALFILITVGWGLFVRGQRDLMRALHDRAEQLEAGERARMEQAREAERRRIAGEMHDVLAHRLSLLSVHAGALEYRPDAPPGEIAEAAAVIRASARSALNELRDVIGVLREPARDGTLAPPQPTLAEIPALIEESRAAGMRVGATLAADGGDALLGRTAYRIVQEGLTNARRHSPASAVEVSVTAGERLVVEVVSRGTARATNGLRGAGNGLIGLTERVALAGGELEHGTDERGDFVLRATLPWTP